MASGIGMRVSLPAALPIVPTNGLGQQAESISWEAAIKNLETTLLHAQNPFMVKAILDCFGSPSSILVSTEDGIREILDKARGPEVILRVLLECHESIKSVFGEQNRENFQFDVRDIRDALEAALITITTDCDEKIAKFGPYKAMLYKDPTFQCLAAEDISEVDEMFAQRKRTQSIENKILDLCKKISKDWEFKFPEEIPADWTARLRGQAPQLFDLIEMIVESYDSLPNGSSVSSDSIVAMWRQPVGDFYNKKLYLSLPAMGINFVGYIRSARRSGDEIVFQDDNKAEVTISRNAREGAYLICYKFYQSRALSSRFLDLPQGIEISIKTPVGSKIQSGRYRIAVTELKKKLTEGAQDFLKALVKRGPRQKNYEKVIQLESSKRAYKFVYTETEIDGELRRVAVTLDNEMITLETFDQIRVTELNTMEATISEAQATLAVKIKEETDERTIKLEALEKIRVLKQGLLDHLTEKDPHLLKRLINDYIHGGESSLHIASEESTASEKYVMEQLETIKSIYLKPIEKETTCKELLLEVILHANRQTMIGGVENFEVINAMQLLQKAVKSVAPAEKLPGVFFMGNTGSGKSTSVGYLLGGKLELVKNDVGDLIYRYKEDQDESKLPKIGHKLGESETLYASGFPYREYGALVDCPGFLETRGEAYQLCTNLSIDQAIKAVDSIRALVVVLPAVSFTLDRANSVIELIRTVRDKFPFAFTSSKSDPSKVYQNRVFMLITKSIHLSDETFESLEKGTRFGEFLQEANASLSKLNAETDETKPASLKSRSLEERIAIWESIVTMYREHRIAFLEVKSKGSPSVFLEQYFGSEHTEIPKKEYQSALEEKGPLERRFGSYVEVSSNTWSEHILNRFESFSPLIAIAKRKIQDCQEAINRDQAVANRKEDEIKNLKNLQRQNKDLLKRCRDLGAGVEIPAELQSDVARFISLQTHDTLQAKEQLELEVDRAAADVDREEAILEQCEQEIERLRGDIERLTTETNALSIGSYTDVIYETNYKKSDVFVQRTWKTGARERCLAENREPVEDDFLKGSEKYVSAFDDDGTRYHIVSISKSYRLTPANDRVAALFKDSIKTGASRSAEYEAKLDGKHFTVDLGMALESSGRKVTYAFQTHWKKGRKELPEIKIVHTVPNREYNKARIINNQARLRTLNEMLAGARARSEDSEELINARAILERQRGNLSELEQQLALQERESRNQFLEQHIQNLEQRIQAAQRELDGRREEINRKNQQLPNLRRKVDQLEQDQLRYALIIDRDWEICTVLRQFVDMILSGSPTAATGDQLVRAKESTLEACRQFKTIFDEKGKRLKDQAAQLLERAMDVA